MPGGRWVLHLKLEPKPHREFFWQALQSIEKYLKAGLLLNDCNAKGGHDIVALYKKHCKVFNGIAIQEFTKPAGLGNEYWDEGKVEKFIERIAQFGSPNSRYGLVPFVRRQSDLFKLDQLVYSLRRLSVPLEWTIGEDWPVDEASKKHAGSKVRDALQRTLIFIHESQST